MAEGSGGYGESEKDIIDQGIESFDRLKHVQEDQVRQAQEAADAHALAQDNQERERRAREKLVEAEEEGNTRWLMRGFEWILVILVFFGVAGAALIWDLVYDDEPSSQPVAGNAQESPQDSTGSGPSDVDVSGIYDVAFTPVKGEDCGAAQSAQLEVAQEGSSLTIVGPGGTFTGTLKDDRSFALEGPNETLDGRFVEQGGDVRLRSTYQLVGSEECFGRVEGTRTSSVLDGEHVTT